MITFYLICQAKSVFKVFHHICPLFCPGKRRFRYYFKIYYHLVIIFILNTAFCQISFISCRIGMIKSGSKLYHTLIVAIIWVVKMMFIRLYELGLSRNIFLPVRETATSHVPCQIRHPQLLFSRRHYATNNYLLHSPIIPRPMLKTGNDVCAYVEFLAVCITAFKRNASAGNPKCYKL